MSVLVVTETNDGQFTENTMDLAAFGKDVANVSGLPLTCLVIGNGLEGILGELGDANEVVYVEDPKLANYVPDLWESVISEIAAKKSAKYIVFSYSSMAVDVSAAIAQKLVAHHYGACQKIQSGADGIEVVSGSYGGKVLVTTKAADLNVLSVVPGSETTYKWTKSGGATITKESADFLSPGKIAFKQMHLPDSSDVDITTYELLVSVGRGIQDEANIELAEELATALNTVVSGSRPVIDQGWLPKTRQVGKSGKSVKPKLYLALGISGAPEHVEGMRNSLSIIAVNTDPKAPIFNIAEYGVNTDLFDLVPELIEAINNRG